MRGRELEVLAHQSQVLFRIMYFTLFDLISQFEAKIVKCTKKEIKMIKKIKDYLNNDERIYSISILLLIISLLWLIASVYIDIAKEDNGSFIQRSGAIIVLFGVMVEFALSNIRFIDRSSSVFVEGKPIETTIKIPLKYDLLKNTAHIYIVVGTFIWGYIDCFWKCL